jgi:hypothetical protein
MLLLAVLAGIWAQPAHGLRSAGLVLSAVLVFAGVSYGVEEARQTGTRAPDVTVDGKPYSLQSGKILIFFFDPQCGHCLDAAKRMAKYQWGSTRVVAVPVEQSQYAAPFLEETGLHAVVSEDFEALKKVFGFQGYPSGVALQNGRQKASLTKFEDAEPAASLKRLGFIQ